MKSYSPTLLLLLFTLLFTTACTDDQAVDADQLTGKWTLVRGTKNNMTTELLDGLYFDFREDGSLGTNLLGNENDGTYTQDGENIVTDGVGVNLTYTVKELTDSTLHLQSKYQNYQFGFELVRGE